MRYKKTARLNVRVFDNCEEKSKMNKKMKWWQIAGLLIDLAGAAFLIVCIATDINDDVFLPAALGCILTANVLQLVFNIRNNRKK